MAETKMGLQQRTRVRSYSAADFDVVKGILCEYPSPTGASWTEASVAQMITDALKETPDGLFVAEVAGTAIGFSVAKYLTWFGIAYLDYIQVKTEWIGQGVGGMLIERCAAWAKKKGARILYTETGRDNKRAIGFYRKHGFRITGSIPQYYREGLDAVILVKKLR